MAEGKERDLTHGPPALIYCRVSTRKQDDEGTSLDTQEQLCRTYAAEKGYVAARVTREVYSGAELWDRPKLTQDREAIRAGAFAALIAYATDRLSRDPIHLALIADECERHAVELHFVSEPLDSTDEGRLIQYVKGYAAKLEREKIKERMMRGRLARLQSGKIHSWGPEMYGYRRDNEAGVRVVFEPEAAVVRRIFRMVVEDGQPVRSIVRTLNAEGIPAPSVGKLTFHGRVPRWGTGTVHRILREPAYKGETHLLRWKRSIHAVPEERPEEDRMILKNGSTPALMSREVWEAAQAQLSANKGEQTRNVYRPYLLRGLIVCAVCGRKMRSTPEHGLRVYRCASRETPDGPCGSSRVPADDTLSIKAWPRDRAGHLIPLEPAKKALMADVQGVESWAWENVAAVLRDPALIAAELERQQDQGQDSVIESDLAAAKRALARIEKAQERLVRKFSASDDDAFPWDVVEREISRLEAEKKSHHEAIADLQRRTARQREHVDVLAQLAAYCEHVAGRLETFGFEERRLAFEALGIQVIANGRQWELRGSIPLPSVAGTAYTISGRTGRNTALSFSLRSRSADGDS